MTQNLCDNLEHSFKFFPQQICKDKDQLRIKRISEKVVNTQQLYSRPQIKRLMLRPQDMRLIHSQQVNKRTFKFKPDSLNSYMSDKRQQISQQRKQQSPSTEFIDCTPFTIDLQIDHNSRLIQSKTTDLTTSPIKIINTSKLISRNIFETATTNNFQTIEYEGQSPQKPQKITSRISPNPQASRLPFCEDIQKRFREKRDNDKLDSSLIVKSRQTVMTRVAVNRNKSASHKQCDEGTVMVPCGPKHLRARNWPIKADLFLMKMKDVSQYDERSFVDMHKREDYFVQRILKNDDPFRLFKRVKNAAHKYLPGYLNWDVDESDYHTIVNL